MTNHGNSQRTNNMDKKEAAQTQNTDKNNKNNETAVQRLIPYVEMTMIIVAISGVMVGGTALAFYKFFGVSLF